MTSEAKETWSKDGIECPECSHIFYPDEGCYYADDYDYDCENCGAKCEVTTFHSVSFTTVLKEVTP